MSERTNNLSPTAPAAASWSRPAHRPALRRRGRAARRPGRGALVLNLAPMIDVTFLLLIFFLVTTTFKRAEGLLASRLPRDRGTPSVALPISPIIIHLSAAGPGQVDFALRIENVVRTPTTFNELADFLVAMQGNPGFDEKTPVVIHADSTVRWDHVVNCWNAAVRASSRNITFSGG